jgi:hypothetical protein
LEAGRLVFAPQAPRDVLMQLFGYMAMADFYEADWRMACPRMERSAMYRPRRRHRPEGDEEGAGAGADESNGVSAVSVRRPHLRDYCDR